MKKKSKVKKLPDGDQEKLQVKILNQDMIGVDPRKKFLNFLFEIL